MKKEYIFGALILAVIIVLIIKRKSIVENLVRLKGKVERSVFIAYYENLVKKVTKGTGLFPSVMMAQAILESADSQGNVGNSTLARVYNNFFGIKADSSWKGAKVNLKTGEVFDGVSTTVNDAFRVYKDVETGFKDRVAFLKNNSRYTKAGVFSAQTPEAQAAALKAAGYATDPDYVSKITGLINKHNLKELDK